MLHLVDNDVVLKLGRYNALDYAVKCWEGYASIRRLSTCPYALCPSPIERALKRCRTQEAVDRIKVFCEKTAPIPAPSASDLLGSLVSVPAIDEGEALLWAFAVETNGSWSYTGDKRSIRALHRAPELDIVRKALAGRTYCLEHLVALLIIQEGLGPVVATIRSDDEADTALNAIVGSNPTPTIDTIWEGLLSYYSHLRKETGDLLADFPQMPKP